MNIQSIGNFYQHNFAQRNNNNTTFGMGTLFLVTRSYYNPAKYSIDKTVFSTKRHFTDVEICNRMLKDENDRFSPKEISDLNNALKTYRINVKKAPLLKELLDIQSTNGEKLKSDDIIAFLYVTDCSTSTEQNALKTLVKYEQENFNELNEKVFVPLEDCPQMLKELSKINTAFKNLSEENRGKLLSDTFDIVQASEYAYRTFSMDIAKKLNMKNSSSFVFRILLDAASTLANSGNAERRKFKTLLNSFTEDRLNKIQSETANFYSGQQEQEYIDKYLKEYNII